MEKRRLCQDLTPSPRGILEEKAEVPLPSCPDPHRGRCGPCAQERTVPNPWPKGCQDPSCPLKEERGWNSGMWPRAWNPRGLRSQEAHLRVVEAGKCLWVPPLIFGVTRSCGTRHVLVTPPPQLPWILTARGPLSISPVRWGW